MQGPDIGLDLWLVQYDPRQFQLKLALNGLGYVASLAGGEPQSWIRPET